MKLYQILGFRRIAGSRGWDNTRFKKPNWDITKGAQPWWHFDIGFHSPHDEDIEDDDDKHLVFKLRILGWSIWHTFGKPLKRDWDVSFGWWDQGFKIYYGPQTKIGGDNNCSTGKTCYYSFISYPWSKRRCWERIKDDSGKIIFYSKDRNWYAWQAIRLYRKIFGVKPKKFSFDKFREQERAEKQVSKTFDYQYTLKSGEVQNRKVTCYFSESFYGWISLPFIGRVHRYCNFTFSDEVGERSGSWKGGVIGSAIDVKKKTTMEEALEMLKLKKFH